MNNDYENDLEKTKSLNDLTDLIAKETEDYLPEDNNSLEDDILNNMGIGYRGYGLEKEDIDELMRDAIDCVYNHLRKENRTFCLKK